LALDSGQNNAKMAGMNIQLDRSKAIPLARQIEAEIERLIQTSLLAPGVKLPATRELAETLGVNRATVSLAYEELVAAGLAHAHVGQGTFVAPRQGAAPAPPAEPLRPLAIDWSGLFSRSARIIGADEERRRTLGAPTGLDSSVISFAGGMPDSDLFPTDAFRKVLNGVIRDEGDALLQYYPTGGYPPLRQYLSTYLLRVGIEARPEEILIVNGSQQGFDLIARTLLDPGDMIAIEQPTYPRAMEVFRSFGAQLLAVPWDGEGPRADVLERLLERHSAKLFYCQPSAHNPTGMVITPPAGRRLLTAASRHQVPIVEDGFDGSLYYGPRPVAPLKASDREGVVIYIGTFSKILFPGLRLGWVVAPAPLRERLQAAKQLADLHTSALIQAAVHRFCDRRLLDRHVARVAREYGRRRDLLVGSLKRRAPEGTEWTEPRGGFSLLLTLPTGLQATALLPAAIERGVAFTPGDPFFVDGSGERTLRLSFSSVATSRIDEGVRRLMETIRVVQRRPLTHRTREGVAVPVV
jgi:DNA-binding transcriptional MocR family regulator